jgi:hypothetical protein
LKRILPEAAINEVADLGGRIGDCGKFAMAFSKTDVEQDLAVFVQFIVNGLLLGCRTPAISRT